MEALYATHKRSDGTSITFRIGRPVKDAYARWSFLDDRRGGFNGHHSRAIRVRWDGRWYSISFFEIREVDKDGRGLGSERHGNAFTLPYASVRYAR